MSCKNELQKGHWVVSIAIDSFYVFLEPVSQFLYLYFHSIEADVTPASTPEPAPEIRPEELPTAVADEGAVGQVAAAVVAVDAADIVGVGYLKICPMCESQFSPAKFSQEAFETHVLAHFQVTFVALFLSNQTGSPCLICRVIKKQKYHKNNDLRVINDLVVLNERCPTVFTRMKIT